MSTYDQKPPVEPIGRILYTEEYGDYNAWPRIEAKYDTVCQCKGFSSDCPFSVYKSKDEKDKKPFKVTFYWRNSKHKYKTIGRFDGNHKEIDSNTYHMTEILEEHATKTAAQTAMRRFAKEAIERVGKPATSEGEWCHGEIGHHGDKFQVKVGDLLYYDSCPGILWRVIGERRASDDWLLKITPAFDFLVNDGTVKDRELGARESHNLRHLNLVDLGVVYTKLGNLLKDEAKRRSE